MRLINVHNRHLHEFFDAETPEYAILSHTWGDDEVTFDDVINNRGHDKEAFRKIRFLCNQAIEDALDWAWLDTCCINKDSSAELSEAINSMYRWYHRARCCYAYLSDIEPEVRWDDDHVQLLSHDPWIMQIAASKWFTRGWTLQELLAPQHEKFYGKKWNYLGTRDDLAPVLARMAGIRESVLRAPERSITQCSVAEKMSWAANRKTSRIEDKAYCLLGIFEVNMPMLYGEGDRAFLRLQEEIIKAIDDHSIFVWQPQRPEERHLLLAPSPDRFTHGNMIVTIPQLHHVDGHTLGNTGLRISLPLVHAGLEDYWHGILGCRYRDDYQNIIALCLKNRVSEAATPSTLFVSPTVARSQRYVIAKAPLRSEDLPASANVIISRALPKAETQSETAGAKYWFNLGESSDVSIIAAYPPEHFNSQTLVMDLTSHPIQYGAVLVALEENVAWSAGYDEHTWHEQSLAIVFGGWTAPGTAETDVNRDQVGIFGVVQSNLKNLANACRFAVSRSIYRSPEASQQHIAWVRSVYNVPWSRNYVLNVSFKGDRQIGMLREVVNVVDIELVSSIKEMFSNETKVAPMPILKQSTERDGNPLSVMRLQDVVRSWVESDLNDDDDRSREEPNEGPDPDAIYELEDDSWRAQPPMESDSE